MDTRSPGEFAEGAFPHTVNLPLMDDEQRAQVGLCYKQQGQQAEAAEAVAPCTHNARHCRGSHCQ